MANKRNLMSLDELHYEMTEVFYNNKNNVEDPEKLNRACKAAGIILGIHKQKQIVSDNSTLLRKGVDWVEEAGKTYAGKKQIQEGTKEETKS